MALAGLLSAVFGVILEPMQDELGWSRAQISTGPLVVSFMGLFLAAPGGHLIDRLGSRFTGIIVVLTTFTAIMSMSQIGDQLWQWWAAWSIFGIAGAFTTTVWMAPVSTIFNKGRGMAIAATIAGASISSTAAPPIAEYFVQNYGWRTALLALGIIWCGLVLPLVVAFVPGKQDRDKAKPGPESASSENIQPAGPGGLSPREGFLSRNFYLLVFASLISGLFGLALILNLVPILTFTGISRGDAVIIAGIMGLASLAGRLIGGWLMDRFDVRHLAILAAVLSALFPLTLIVA
ncbi:MAG: MFS transporter, partial [Sphingomonadaceae bacterium]|nr:MFS transporter [Sphingomonadaceae bacterium]